MSISDDTLKQHAANFWRGGAHEKVMIARPVMSLSEEELVPALRIFALAGLNALELGIKNGVPEEDAWQALLEVWLDLLRQGKKDAVFGMNALFSAMIVTYSELVVDRGYGFELKAEVANKFYSQAEDLIKKQSFPNEEYNLMLLSLAKHNYPLL